MKSSSDKNENIKTTVSQTLGKRLSLKKQKGAVHGKEILSFLQQRAALVLSTTKKRIKAVPDWLKSRPQTVRDWRKADKKKRKYRSFQLQKRIKAVPKYIPSTRVLLKQTVVFIGRNLGLFLGIAFIHALLYALIVRTTATVDIASVQGSFREVFGNSPNSAKGTAALLGTIIGSPRKVENGGFTVTFLVILFSLIYVWAIRERINDVFIRVRDAVFNGLAPLASILAVLLFMGLQLIPFGIATFFYTSARSNSLFASGFEDLFFFSVTFFAGLLSFYYITSSVISLYVAALPGVYPIRALRAGGELVKYRRIVIFRRLLGLAFVLVASYLLMLLIVVRIAPGRTYAFIDTFQIGIVPFVNVYIYKLYRSLL